MSSLDRIATKLADDTMKVMDATGEDRLYMEVAAVLGASSQTLEEAFLTEVRIRLSEEKARAFLNGKLRQYEAKLRAAEAEKDGGAG